MMIYNVRQGQTLAEICEEIHLENPGYLMDFHNQNCPASERFQDNKIRGKRVFIPNPKQITELNQKIRDRNDSYYDFPDSGYFPFSYDLWAGTYNISQTTYFNGEMVSVHRKKISLDLERVNDSSYHFLLSAFDFRKNDKLSESTMSALATRCIEIIYPVRIRVNSQGQILNIELTKSPEQIYADLEAVKRYFTDDYTSDYIERIRKTIEYPKDISLKFESTLTNTFLFGSFYGAKLETWTHSQTYQDFYPWIFDADAVGFDLQNRMCPKEREDDEFIKILQKGNCSDYRSLEDLYLKNTQYNAAIPLDENSIDGEHVAEYIFKRENLALQRIEASFRNFIHEDIGEKVFLLEKTEDHNQFKQ